MTRRIAVILGGRSSENAISLASAASVIDALERTGNDVVAVEIDRSGRWQLETQLWNLVHDRTRFRRVPAPSSSARRARVATTLADVDVVFPVLHGPFGEDGTVQGLLELAGVPYVGAGVLASALCMDKDLFKSVMRDHDIPVTRTSRCASATSRATRSAFPCFIKPARLGSSVGITKAHDESELRAGVALAFEHDEKVLVEQFVSGVEVEVGVLGNLRADRVAPGRDRGDGERVVRLRGEVRRGRDGPRGPGADHRRADRARAGACGRARSSRPTARAWRAPTCSCATTARCS